jgi:hypothetical protein
MIGLVQSSYEAMVKVMLSAWGTPVFAGTLAVSLLAFGFDPAERTYWLILVAAVAPFALWDVSCWLLYAARGRSYREVRREVARATLAEIRRRRAREAR